MRLSKSFFYTIREDLKDEESNSGNLLVRSGMVKKISNGIYMYMPLGLRVINNIEQIIRDEMNKTGAQELLMPNLLPEEVYVNSGRRTNFGKDMFSLKDRYERNYVLGPTHEEFFVDAAKQMIKSYKDMPFNLYQIGNKYRDEPRPRYGLIRVREFFMKDAYSFDIDNAGMDKSYEIMMQTYINIFNRLGIKYQIVKADMGAMGGLLSEEFQAITPIGEDKLILCENNDYASNFEIAVSKLENEQVEEHVAKELVSTPNVKSIEQVTNFLNVAASKLVKTLIYQADDKFYACLVPGNRDVNELKLAKLLSVKEVKLADAADVLAITKSSIGFVGPIDLNISIIADKRILMMHNFVTGANRDDYHYINVNMSDFKVDMVDDITNVNADDLCINCGGKLHFEPGIEVGNIFKLGTKYSESLGLNYTDQNNLLKPVVMGCYGIGVGRIMAALVEQNSDEAGIKWANEIAPYKVAIVVLNSDYQNMADELYSHLNKENISVILDDRDVRAGVKFADMDLIGIPVRITIGKKASEGIVELKTRDGAINLEINYQEVLSEIKKLIS